MKGLLVDVLRQKDDDRESEGLSDSGSYATPRADVAAAIANEAGKPEASGDLELMATGVFVVANDEQSPKPDVSETADAGDPLDGGLSRTIVGDTTRVITGAAVVPADDSLPSMPLVARYAPPACAALALLAALTWFGFQQLELHQERSPIVGSTSSLRVDTLPGESGITGTAPRFRYLGVDGRPLDEEIWQ